MAILVDLSLTPGVYVVQRAHQVFEALEFIVLISDFTQPDTSEPSGCALTDIDIAENRNPTCPDHAASKTSDANNKV